MGVREAGGRSRKDQRGLVIWSNYPLWLGCSSSFKYPLAGPKICPLAAPCRLPAPRGLPVPMRRHRHARPRLQYPVSAVSMPCGKCMTLVSVCGMIMGHLFMATTSSERKIPGIRSITLNYTAS